MAKNIKKILNVLIYLIFIPLTVFLGTYVFKDRQYVVISVILAVLVILGFFMSFERKKTTIKEVSIVTVMVAFSVVGRLIFVAVPSFKPISAIVIIAGIAFGYEAGFMVGALSSLISNFYFGQGAWTPFQMVAFGIIGMLAGLLFRKGNVKTYKVLLFGSIAGIFYSMFMDIWTVISIDNAFNFSRYGAVLLTSLPIACIYVVSNVVFLLVLTKPMLKQADRLKAKYRIFEVENEVDFPEDF